MLITSRSLFEFLHSALLAKTSLTMVMSEVIIRRRSKYRESGIRCHAHSRLTSLTLSGAAQIPPISDISCLMFFTTRKVLFSIPSSSLLLSLDEKMDLLMFANGANVLQIWSTKFELNLHWRSKWLQTRTIA